MDGDGAADDVAVTEAVGCKVAEVTVVWTGTDGMLVLLGWTKVVLVWI